MREISCEITNLVKVNLFALVFKLHLYTFQVRVYLNEYIWTDGPEVLWKAKLKFLVIHYILC